MYNELIQTLIGGDFSFFTTYDLITNEHAVVVEAEDNMALIYAFDRKQTFKKMALYHSSFKAQLHTIAINTLSTGQFQRLTYYNGNKKFPIRRSDEEEED